MLFIINTFQLYHDLTFNIEIVKFFSLIFIIKFITFKFEKLKYTVINIFKIKI